MSPRLSIPFAGLLVLSSLYSRSGALESLDGIAVGGKYRMQLTTGDRLVGTVELKDDTSLIVETDRGPFTFRGALILEYEMLEPPARPAAKSGQAKGTGEAEILTYGRLLARGPSQERVEIRIKSGTVFVGNVADINEENLSLNVEGSLIPIGQNVIARIATIVEEPEEEPEEERVPSGPFDTIYVANPKTDEYGNALEPLMLVGTIRQYDDEGLTVSTPKGQIRTLTRDKVVRVVRHTANDYESEIRRYAEPLFCSEGMILIDLPPGKEGRPFFKVCIDRFEYPNQQGVMPKGNVSYQEAAKLCEARGKRLCTATEWQWACSGLEGYTYPYGWHFDEDKCNARGVQDIETSGLRHHCRGKFGVNDMTGNIFEWVTTADGSPALMGGPYSKCQTVSPGVGGSAKPQTGFRCCKGN